MKRELLRIFRKAIRPFLRRGIGRFYLVKLGYRLATALLNPVDVQGHKMFLDPTDSMELLLNPLYEKLETEIFKKEIKEGNIALDVGANIGYYTLLAAKAVGDKGKVFAFEPDPNNFSLLEKNVRINHYQNVVLIQKAVSDRTGSCQLYIYDEQVHSKTYDSGDSQRVIEAEAVRLDDYLAGRQARIDLIKIDVEGAEAAAFRGMNSVFQKNPGLKLLIEFYPPRIRKSGLDPVETLKFLMAQGFKLYNIDERKEEIRPVLAEEIEQFCRDKTQTCLLCKREY